MARGKSGRIVLEINPELKKALYLELTRRDQTLKDWFVAEAQELAYNSAQANLFEGTRAIKAPAKTANKKQRKKD